MDYSLLLGVHFLDEDGRRPLHVRDLLRDLECAPLDAVELADERDAAPTPVSLTSDRQAPR